MLHFSLTLSLSSLVAASGHDECSPSSRSDDIIDGSWLASWIGRVKYYDPLDGNTNECWFDVTTNESHYFRSGIRAPYGRPTQCILFKMPDTNCVAFDLPNWMEDAKFHAEVPQAVGYTVFKRRVRGSRGRRSAPSPAPKWNEYQDMDAAQLIGRQEIRDDTWNVNQQNMNANSQLLAGYY